ncbi:MAG: hypothetical protein M3007_06100, partial [Candidatus Eremiobacteraeota bacterium]|nr:hypothetical protein [Candidatus Eremiobacteraeota bacterium]
VHQGEQGGAKKRWGSSGVLRWRQRSRRRYWIKHHGLLWYWSLCAALAARYALYVGVVTGTALLIRKVKRFL